MSYALLVIGLFHLVLWSSIAVLAALEPPRRVLPRADLGVVDLDAYRRQRTARDEEQLPRSA